MEFETSVLSGINNASEDIPIVDAENIRINLPASSEKGEDAEKTCNLEVAKDFPYIAEVTDVSIKVQYTIFHVNRGILIVASPVFLKMLTTEFKEKKEGSIHLTGKTAEEISLFLKCLYPNIHIQLTDNLVDTVLPLASEYMVDSLRERCERYLEEKYFNQFTSGTPSLDNLFKFVGYGVTCGTHSVQGKSIKALAQWESSSIEEHDNYNDLPTDIQARIWKAKVKELENCSSSVFNDISRFCNVKNNCSVKRTYFKGITPVRHLLSRCTSCNETINMDNLLSEVESMASKLKSWKKERKT